MKLKTNRIYYFQHRYLEQCTILVDFQAKEWQSIYSSGIS